MAASDGRLQKREEEEVFNALFTFIPKFIAKELTMARTPNFRALKRAAHIAHLADRHHLDSREATQRFIARDFAEVTPSINRRNVLKGFGAALAGASLITTTPQRSTAAPTRRSGLKVNIVGAGMAGLAADCIRGRTWGEVRLTPGTK